MSANFKVSHIWRRNQRALALIASIMLIVFSSIVILGLSQFVIQREQQSAIQRTTLNLIDNAHAGIHYSVYNYRWRDLAANGGFFLGNFTVSGNNTFSVGGTAAQLLMVRPTAAVIGGTAGNLNKELQIANCLQNANRSSSITIASMTVTWSFGGNITIVRINGANQWTGTAASGTNLNITDFALNTTPSIYAINYLRFDTVIPVASTVDVDFIMTDATTRTVRLWPVSTINNFTVRVSGKWTGSNAYRTLEADYNTLTSKVTRLVEINTLIP